MNNNETTVIVVTEPIRKELKGLSITEKALKEMADKCLALKLTDPNDEETFNLIEENRKQVKRTRVLIEKTYEAKKKELRGDIKLLDSDSETILGLISPSEEWLKGQAKIYTDEQNRKAAAEEKRLQDSEEARLKLIDDRKNNISKIGCKLSEDETAYEIGALRVPIIQEGRNIFEVDADTWGPIIQMFVDEALRLQEEAEKKEKADAEERLRLANAKAESDKKALDANKKLEELQAKEFKRRIALCKGTTWDGGQLLFEDVIVASNGEVENLTDEQWEALANKHNNWVDNLAVEVEKAAKTAKVNQRKAALIKIGFTFIGNAYEFAGSKVYPAHLVDATDEAFEVTLKDGGELKIKVDEKKAEERKLALAPDKEKLKGFYTATLARAGCLVELINVTTDEGKAIMLEYIEASIKNLKTLKEQTDSLK